METINAIELADESVYPDEIALRRALGEGYSAYESLLALFARYGLEAEWRYYRDGKAWLCKVQKKKKTVVWMSAWKGYVQACVYFPERLVGEVLGSAISAAAKEKIESTKSVGASKPCVFEVRNGSVLADLETVMALKIAAK